MIKVVMLANECGSQSTHIFKNESLLIKFHDGAIVLEDCAKIWFVAPMDKVRCVFWYKN